MTDLEHLRALGCASNLCPIAPRGGQRTSGPCRCLDGLDAIARLRVRQALALLHRMALPPTDAERARAVADDLRARGCDVSDAEVDAMLTEASRAF